LLKRDDLAKARSWSAAGDLHAPQSAAAGARPENRHGSTSTIDARSLLLTSSSCSRRSLPLCPARVST